MIKINDEDKKHVYTLVSLIEKVVRGKTFDQEHLKDEVEKHFSYLCQGKDDLNPYQRRDAGVDDKTWNEAVRNCRKALKLEVREYEELF